MPRKTLEISFPSAGVVRRSGLHAGANGRGPYSAVWATNVRLEDSLTTRLRGGSFAAAKLVTERDGDQIAERDGDRVTLRTGEGITFIEENKEDPVYRDRAVEIRDTDTGDDIAIWVSRQGDHTDFTLSADVSDMQRPTLFPLAEGGETGGAVIAVIPHKDSHMLCFTANETWVQAGDPLTGSRRNVSRQVGIIASEAWCRFHDTVYFLSSRGLYSISADGGRLKALSEDKIPEDLTGVEDDTCTMAYSHADRGVYIHLSEGVSWFYDTERDQFWPFTADSSDSHVLIGPFRLGNANSYGRVLKLHGVIATGSDDVDWRLVTGDTAEEAAANGKLAIEAAVAGNDYSSYVASEGTWSSGRAHMAYPRIRAVWCCLWLHSEGEWAYEAAVMDAMVSGKWR